MAEARQALLMQRVARGADAMSAREALEIATLGGAMTVAGEWPGQAGAVVADTARTAFANAMRVVAVFGCAMMLLAGWMAARLMRDGEGEGHAAAIADEASGA